MNPQVHVWVDGFKTCNTRGDRSAEWTIFHPAGSLDQLDCGDYEEGQKMLKLKLDYFLEGVISFHEVFSNISIGFGDSYC